MAPASPAEGALPHCKMQVFCRRKPLIRRSMSRDCQARGQMHHFRALGNQMAAAAFDDGLQIFDRLLEAIIDDHVVEFSPVTQVLGGVAQAALNDLGGIGAAPLEPELQRLARRRQDENAAGLRQSGAHLAGALPIDFQQQLLAIRQRLLHGSQPGTVAIVEDPGVLEKLMVRDHFLKALGADEVVIAPGDFVGPGLARGVGHRELDARLALHQGLYQTGLAGAGGCRNYVKASLWHRSLRELDTVSPTPNLTYAQQRLMQRRASRPFSFVMNADRNLQT